MCRGDAGLALPSSSPSHAFPHPTGECPKLNTADDTNHVLAISIAVPVPSVLRCVASVTSPAPWPFPPAHGFPAFWSFLFKLHGQV